MPTYKVTAPDGRTVTLTGDSPPTEAELEEVFKQLPQSPDLSAGDRFVRGVASQVNPVNLAKGIYSVATDFPGFIEGQKQAMGEQWEKGGRAAIEGRWPEAVARGLAGTIPLMGPAAADVGERIGSGEDKATASGEAVGMLATAAIPMALTRGGKAALQAANKVRAPFAGEIDPAVAAAAARSGQGIDLPASAVSKAKPVETMEAWAMKGFGGGAAAERYATAASELTARAQQLVARASRYTTESERGIAVARGFQDYRQAWVRTKNALYGEAERAMPRFATPMQNTLDEVVRVLREKSAASKVGEVSDPKFFQRMFKGLTEEVIGPDGKPTGTRQIRQIPVTELTAYMKELNERLRPVYKGGDPFKQGDKGLLLRVKAIMQSELDDALSNASPVYKQKLAAANAKYAEGVEMINSTFGKTINKLAKAGKYDDIARSVANAQMSVDDIPRLLKVAGPEGTQAIRASVLADVVARATKNGRLTPQGLRMALEKFDRSAPGALDAILEPTQAQSLRDFSTLSQSLEKGLKVAEGSQTAFLGRVGALAGTLVTKPWQGLKLLLGDIGFNKFISSPAGQKWMKTGYRPWGAPMFGLDVPGAAAGSLVISPEVLTGRQPAMQPAPATR